VITNSVSSSSYYFVKTEEEEEKEEEVGERKITPSLSGWIVLFQFAF
jgi:hypothetical protein